MAFSPLAVLPSPDEPGYGTSSTPARQHSCDPPTRFRCRVTGDIRSQHCPSIMEAHGNRAEFYSLYSSRIVFFSAKNVGCGSIKHFSKVLVVKNPLKPGFVVWVIMYYNCRAIISFVSCGVVARFSQISLASGVMCFGL